MTNSILLTIKKLLGISEEYHAFDIDILTDINATFLTLNQLGIGPRLPFQLPLMMDPDDEYDPAVATTWDDFLGKQKQHLAAVQTYVYQRVRLMFDPPTNSFMVTAMQESCKEFEWRFTVQPKTMGAVENVESYRTVYPGDDAIEEEPLEPLEPIEPPEEGGEEPIEPTEPIEGEGSGIELMRTTRRAAPASLYDIFT